MKKKFLTSIIVTAFILAGCGMPQTGNGYTVLQQINDPTIAEITPVYETQVERVNNCDGTNPTYNVSYKTIEAQKASFEVSVGAGGLVTGTPIPSVLEVQLEAKITAALAKDYGLTTEKNHDLTLDNVQGTFLEHTIIWKVTRVKGLIEVIYGDGIAQVGFEKIANVELYNRTSQSLGCNGNGASILPTTIVATLGTQPPAQPPSTSPSTGSLVNRASLGSDVPLAPLVKDVVQNPSQVSQTQLENAVRQIQVETARLGVWNLESNSLDLPQENWWLVWCSMVTSKYNNGIPAGWYYLFEQQLPTFGQLYVISPTAESRHLDSCNSPKGWWGVVISLSNP